MSLPRTQPFKRISQGTFSRDRSQLLYPRVTTVALLFINSTPSEVSAIPCVLFGNPLRALFLKNRDFFCYREIFLPNTRGPLGCLLGFWPSGPKPCGGNYTVIKHDGHLRTRGKCRQHEPQASVFYVSRVFSNVRSVLSQCNTRLRLLHLLYDIEVMWRKTIKHAFSMFYTLIKHGFLTNQSAHTVLSIL